MSTARFLKWTGLNSGPMKCFHVFYLCPIYELSYLWNVLSIKFLSKKFLSIKFLSIKFLPIKFLSLKFLPIKFLSIKWLSMKFPFPTTCLQTSLLKIFLLSTSILKCEKTAFFISSWQLSFVIFFFRCKFLANSSDFVNMLVRETISSFKGPLA